MSDSLYPRGSEWRRWDLHVHTPASILANRFPNLPTGGPDWDTFTDRLNASGVSVIGATDYFTIDGYKVLRERKAAGSLPNVLAIFPNIEFRLDNVIASRRDGQEPRRLNFHAIFSDEIDPSEIEEHFLHDIEFHFEGSPGQSDDKRKLKRSNLEALGKELLAEHEQFRTLGMSALQIGAMTAVVRHAQITEVLTSSARFRDKYLLIFPEELSNLIDWDGQDHNVRKVLLQKSHCVFSSNPRTVSWCVGLPPYEGGPEQFRQEFKSLKPCVHGSDAHDLDQIGKPCAQRGVSGHSCAAAPSSCDLRNCWVKADPTFEGLRQLLYEPKSRVAIQSDTPKPIKSQYSVANIAFSAARVNGELSMGATSMPLNDGLVAVTGSKGSGKTAFVDLLAHCYSDRERTGDNNSFVKRIADEAPGLEIRLTFANGDTFTKTLTDGRFVESGQISYIAQGELERYIDDNSDLDSYVDNLIRSSPSVVDSVAEFELLSLDGDIQVYERSLRERSESIEALEMASSDEVLASVKLQGTQVAAELKDCDVRIAESQKRLSTHDVAVATERQGQLASLKKTKDELLELRRLVDEAIRFGENDWKQFAGLVGGIRTLATSLLPSVPPLPQPAFPVEELRTMRPSVQTRLAGIVQEIENKEREAKNFEAGRRDHTKLLEKKRELQAKVEGLRKQWTELQERRKEIERQRTVRKETFRALLRTVLDRRKRYADLIATFAGEKTIVLKDLEFRAELSYDGPGLHTVAGDVLDRRLVDVDGERGPSAFSALDVHYRSLLAGDETHLYALVDEVDRLTEALKPKIKKSRAVTSATWYRIMYSNYLTMRPAIFYKRTPLHRLSLGQKATVLMKVYLAQGTHPIIVDSHDDHLDNEFIMEELVDAIRQARNYRQVIVASNNGNVVINSDADQVVLAARDDGTVSYTSGSIENPVIRPRALKVLEGGEDAFRRRQEKYGLG